MKRKFAFTDKALQNLKPAADRYEVADTGAPGLRLRIAPTGRKTFVWYRRVNGQNKPLALGAYPQTTLASARLELERAKAIHAAQLADGAGGGGKQIGTLKELVEDFYVEYVKKAWKRPEDARRIIDTDLLPTLGARRLEALTTPQITRMVRRVVDRGAPVHAGKVLAFTKTLFAYGVAEGYLPANPATGIKAEFVGVESNISDRYLMPEEIRQFWLALDQHKRLSDTVKACLRLLLLSGVRTGELLQATWTEVGEDAWTIPVEHQKLRKKFAAKAKPFVVPITPQMREQFDLLQTLAEKSPFVCASTAEGGRLTDKALSKAMNRLFELKDKAGRPLLDMEKITPHRFRATLRTLVQERLDVEPHVAEKMLNHSLGRIEATYNVSALFEQRRVAMAKWSSYVAALVAPEQRVVPLRKRRRAGA